MSQSETLQACRQRLRAALTAVGIDEADLEAVLLIQAATGLDRLRQMTQPERPLAPAEAAQLAQWLPKRLSRQPLSQILGTCEFYGLPFTVGPDVLCPRPETEMLVELVLTDVGKGGRVLDLGTGSGAIAIAIAAKRPDLSLVAIDRSEAALAVARQNGERLGVTIEWRLGDWTAPLQPAERSSFAAVVSNPPYIPEADWRVLEPEVRDHEPKGALVGGADGLAPYRELPALVWPFLIPGGLFAVELGQGQAPAVGDLFRMAGYRNVQALPDLAGIERVVLGRKATDTDR